MAFADALLLLGSRKAVPIGTVLTELRVKNVFNKVEIFRRDLWLAHNARRLVGYWHNRTYLPDKLLRRMIEVEHAPYNTFCQKPNHDSYYTITKLFSKRQDRRGYVQRVCYV